MNQKKQAAFEFVDQHREEMMGLWREVVSMESGPHEKPGIDAVAARFRSVLEEAGAVTRTVDFEKAGNMLIAEIGENCSKPGVLFLGHMDTAIPAGAIKERPFTIKDGIAYGPGVLDMKGGIVASLYVLKALNSTGYDSRKIKFLLAGDEEVLHAHSTAPDVFVEEAKGYAAAFNVETGFPDNGIVVGRKGVAQFMMEVKGIAAHAGNDPENGRNAILELSHKVIDIQNRSDWGDTTTYNVGVIQGGTTSTAVPDYAKVLIDVRYADPDHLPAITERLEKIAAKTYVEGTSSAVKYNHGIKPMKTTDGVKELFELVRQVSVENGFDEPYAKHVGGASDSSYSVIGGVPTVCAMGVKGGRNHSPEEYAIVESLFERTKVMIASLLKLG
jgi:glutamate carboxypeptidase